MLVKLKVIGGSNAGKEIKIPLAKFFIGRSEDCHLRAQSDLISRHHCALLIEEGHVIARDLKSRNGTLVNGEKIVGDVQLKMGDNLKVGPLEFEVLIDHSLGGNKKSAITDVKQAAERVTKTEKKGDESIDQDINSWLEEAEEDDRSKRAASPETRQYRLDSADYQALLQAGQDPSKATPEMIAAAHDTAKQAAAVASETKAAEDDKKKKPEKKEPGKLPKVNAASAQNSRDAAADMLKKFFNRR
ncbi:MAG TPA: FHA domain-containing protein [Pirellulaceae bacterium]|nr:FHA domain-containing protein [Pirellulaceae bacterium]